MSGLARLTVRVELSGTRRPGLVPPLRDLRPSGASGAKTPGWVIAMVKLRPTTTPSTDTQLITIVPSTAAPICVRINSAYQARLPSAAIHSCVFRTHSQNHAPSKRVPIFSAPQPEKGAHVRSDKSFHINNWRLHYVRRKRCWIRRAWFSGARLPVCVCAWNFWGCSFSASFFRTWRKQFSLFCAVNYSNGIYKFSENLVC